MLTLILTSIIFLPCAILSLAIESLFSSDELIEMGVYLEELQAMSPTLKDQADSSQSGPLIMCAGLSV